MLNLFFSLPAQMHYLLQSQVNWKSLPSLFYFFFFKKNFKPYLLLYFKYVSVLLVLRMFLFIIASYSFSPVTISSLASQWILIIHISSKLSSLYTVCFLQVAFCIFHTFHIAGIPQISSNSRGPKTLTGSSDT